MQIDKNSLQDMPSVSALDSAHLPRHRWYHFKEAFSPSVVQHAMGDANVSDNDIIVDPFSGSGTVVLTASAENLQSVGLEVNPFLAFVSRTKMIHCKSKTLSSGIKKVEQGINTGHTSPLETFSTFSEAGGAKKWLFNQSVLRAFEGGWQATSGEYAPVRDATRLALIGAALDVSNAIKDGKCLRYRKNWKARSYDKQAFLDAFRERIEIITYDIEHNPLRDAKGAVKLGDARNNKILTGREKFKLCVMSPPYLNSFDYTDVYRPELFLGKFVNSNEQLQELRMKTLRSHVQINWNDPIDLDFGSNFVESFNAIKDREDTLWNKRIPDMIQAYFEDMKAVLKNLRAVARNDASLWIVVSTSAYAGIEIPVDLILADIGTKVGWYLREVKTVRHLRRVPGQQWDQLSESKDQKPHLRESIIILDANHNRRR